MTSCVPQYASAGLIDSRLDANVGPPPKDPHDDDDGDEEEENDSEEDEDDEEPAVIREPDEC